MTTLSVDCRAMMLDGLEDFMEVGASTANFTVYQGSTSLCVFPLAAAPFGAGNADSIVASSTPISSTGTEVAGKANRFVVTNQDGDTAFSGTISAIGGGGDIETPSVTVSAGLTQSLNSLVLRMSADGSLSIEASITFV